MSSLFPALTGGADAGRPALRFGERSLTCAGLAAAAGSLAGRLRGVGRVAVWAEPGLETAVAMTGALLAGVAAVPLNPRSGERELAHILSDSAPSLVLAAPGTELFSVLADLPRLDVEASVTRAVAVPEDRFGYEHPALVVYTSGTTGPPKGAVIPRRALASTLDALADVWRWTGDDVRRHPHPRGALGRAHFAAMNLRCQAGRVPGVTAKASRQRRQGMNPDLIRLSLTRAAASGATGTFHRVLGINDLGLYLPKGP